MARVCSMESFLAARRADPRFAAHGPAFTPRTAVSDWRPAVATAAPRVHALADGGVVVQRHFFAAEQAAPAAKRKKSSKGKGSTAGSDTSDGSDGGRCWSNYDPVEGKKPYEKGSCAPEGEKKKKKKRKRDDSAAAAA